MFKCECNKTVENHRDFFINHKQCKFYSNGTISGPGLYVALKISDREIMLFAKEYLGDYSIAKAKLQTEMSVWCSNYKKINIEIDSSKCNDLHSIINFLEKIKDNLMFV